MTHLDNPDQQSNIWPLPPNAGDETDEDTPEPPFLTGGLLLDLVLGFVFGILTFVILTISLSIFASHWLSAHWLSSAVQRTFVCGFVISVQISMFLRWWRRFPDFWLAMIASVFFMGVVTRLFIFG